jgi:isochorismate synthase
MREVIDLYKKQKLEPTDFIPLTEILIQKRISFCCYRFPNSSEINLAIQKGIVPIDDDNNFIIAPFTENSSVSKVLLQKLSVDNLSASFYEKIQALPDTEINWMPLPKEESKEIFLERIHQYLKAIKEGRISKAILSRVIKIDKPKEFNATDFFVKLCDAYPETFVSLFYIPGAGLWVGASPELLLETKNNQYHTVALAATQPKNEKKEYVWRKKEEDEHQLVRVHIESVFKQNDCELINTKGPFSFETGKVAHLKTEYTFGMNSKINSTNIVAQLHPTPAIGGLPVKEALACISRYEGYPRNYYAGYLGETKGTHLVRLFINLRCMQIGKNEITLFVGGGISADSNPEEEWKETIQKSLTLLQILEKPL